MAKVVCIKRHFGKGGELITVGAEAEGKADGYFWAAKSAPEKKLEVATPKKSDEKK